MSMMKMLEDTPSTLAKVDQFDAERVAKLEAALQGSKLSGKKLTDVEKDHGDMPMSEDASSGGNKEEGEDDGAID
ncbi:mesoderm induction early response protein 1 isoform X2 [Sesbania bispinosa]|nr:mesoderm induction early response protein 1 isoform X2 [Sesbania bispinosa]